MGCILGALIGDSCGSYVEFITRHPTIEEIKLTMTMPGGEGSTHGNGAG
jgi:hypothetical protein